MKSFLMETVEHDTIKLYTENKQTYLGEFYIEIDGFYVFEPNRKNAGYYDEFLLTFLLNTLLKLNKEYTEEINNFYNGASS